MYYVFFLYIYTQMVQEKTRNRQAHHNLSIKIVKQIPSSSKIAAISIQYTYKKKRVRRTSPVELPMNVFEKLPNGCGSIKKNFLEKYPVQLKWINKFNGLKNDLEVRMKEGIIDYEYAFKMLRNDYETQIIIDRCIEVHPNNSESQEIFVVAKTIDGDELNLIFNPEDWIDTFKPTTFKIVKDQYIKYLIDKE